MLTKYHAHSEIRRDLSLVLWMASMSSLALIGLGAFQVPAFLGWGCLAGGVLLAVAVIGAWFAREWGRYAIGITSAIMCIADLVKIWIDSDWDGVEHLIRAGVLAYCAVYAFLPSTKTKFVRAREILSMERRARNQDWKPRARRATSGGPD